MTWLEALILGVIEGLTEFLPVSSTGHLILTNSLLGLGGEAMNAYVVVIQFGAILAVVALYKKRVAEMIAGLRGKNHAGLQLLLKLFVAFLPAAFMGLALSEVIDKMLFHPTPVASALIVGGVAMIAVERFVVRRHKRGADSKPLKTISDMTYLDAFLIGCAQCLALWPGTSRSMATILGAQLRGFSDVAAAEVSFLLALPTLSAAMVYKSVLNYSELVEMDGGILMIVVGNLIAFVVAFFAMKWFVGIVTRHGMIPFGIYRIAIGALFLYLALNGFLAFPEKL